MGEDTKLEILKAGSLRALVEEANSLHIRKDQIIGIFREDVLFYMVYEQSGQ